MSAQKSAGIYLETDAGKNKNITVVLADGVGAEQRFENTTAARELLAAMELDYTDYRKEIMRLREEHPLFEERIEIPVADLEDFAAQACLLSAMLKEINPAAFLTVGANLERAFRMEDDGSAMFLLNAGAQILRVLEEPIWAQIRLRNIFEIAFDDLERGSQLERYERLKEVYPMVTDRFFCARRMETGKKNTPLGSTLEYVVGTLFDLYLLELSLYFQQDKERIARCRYCWNYFIPKTKKETIYCDRLFDGQSCKKRGPNVKRRETADTDAALKTYNDLRNRMFARLERYVQAHENSRDRLIQIDASEYDAWICMAHRARTEYLKGNLSTEEFLHTIDINNELDGFEVTEQQSTPPDMTRWRKLVMGNLNFDPTMRYEDIQTLELSKGTDAKWEIFTAKEQIRRDQEGNESLREKYDKPEN